MENFPDPMTEADQPAQRRLAELLEELAGLGFCLPGSISTRQMRCERVPFDVEVEVAVPPASSGPVGTVRGV